MSNARRFTHRTLAALGFLFSVAVAAEAGPPLICHAFDAGTAPLLTWGRGQGWDTPDRSYDVSRLTADTVALLTPDAPILARMENLRRATIYAARDKKAAAELMSALMKRAEGRLPRRPRLVRRRLPGGVVPPSQPHLQVGHAQRS